MCNGRLFLVLITPKDRARLKLDLDRASILTWMNLLVFATSISLFKYFIILFNVPIYNNLRIAQKHAHL
jgi:hypothetical protein